MSTFCCSKQSCEEYLCASSFSQILKCLLRTNLQKQVAGQIAEVCLPSSPFKGFFFIPLRAGDNDQRISKGVFPFCSRPTSGPGKGTGGPEETEVESKDQRGKDLFKITQRAATRIPTQVCPCGCWRLCSYSGHHTGSLVPGHASTSRPDEWVPFLPCSGTSSSRGKLQTRAGRAAWMHCCCTSAPCWKALLLLCPCPEHHPPPIWSSTPCPPLRSVGQQPLWYSQISPCTPKSKDSQDRVGFPLPT